MFYFSAVILLLSFIQKFPILAVITFSHRENAHRGSSACKTNYNSLVNRKEFTKGGGM